MRTPSTPSVTSLSDRALTGDHHAWDALIRRHTPAVRRALLRHGVSDAVASDLIQDAWMHLISQSARGRLEYLALPGLAIKQARRMDHARRRRAWVQRETGTLEDVHRHCGGEDLEHTVAVRRRVSAVQRALSTCPPRSTEIFLAYLDGSAAEVAVEFRISEQRVRQIACEVRKHLRGEVTRQVC